MSASVGIPVHYADMDMQYRYPALLWTDPLTRTLACSCSCTQLPVYSVARSVCPDSVLRSYRSMWRSDHTAIIVRGSEWPFSLIPSRSPTPHPFPLQTPCPRCLDQLGFIVAGGDLPVLRVNLSPLPSLSLSLRTWLQLDHEELKEKSREYFCCIDTDRTAIQSLQKEILAHFLLLFF